MHLFLYISSLIIINLTHIASLVSGPFELSSFPGQNFYEHLGFDRFVLSPMTDGHWRAAGNKNIVYHYPR